MWDIGREHLFVIINGNLNYLHLSRFFIVSTSIMVVRDDVFSFKEKVSVCNYIFGTSLYAFIEN